MAWARRTAVTPWTEGYRPMNDQAPINKIIPFSNVDGPGNRTSIFFQGCTYACKFCHNPETIRLCIHCGACVPGCPTGALRRENGLVRWNATDCVQCDACLKACPHMSSPRIRWMRAEEVFHEIRRAFPYIEGITVSGGDCTLYAAFLKELFPLVRAFGKTCLIDGNGAYDFTRDPELLEVCDGVMLDIKAADPEWSRFLIGNDGACALRSLDSLLRAGKLAEVRTVIFPGRDHENEETVRTVAQRIQNACPYKIIRYRPFGVRTEFQALLGEDTTEFEEAERYASLARSLGATKAFVV